MMRTWLLMLGGLIVWTVHFFGLYAAGEIGGESARARLLVLALTLGALAADGIVAWFAFRQPQGDDFLEWSRSIALTGAGLSLIAVAWQGLAGLAGL